MSHMSFKLIQKFKHFKIKYFFVTQGQLKHTVIYMVRILYIKT